MRIEHFDEFDLPVNDTQRLIGRIINMNPLEDPKLNESNVGLLNLNEENGGNVQKIKLQLSDVQSYSFFDGEIVVVEGTHDQNTARINVTAVHKPAISSIPRNMLSVEELQKISSDLYKDRAVQVMIATGPYTFKNSLSYQGLYDFLALAKKEQP